MISSFLTHSLRIQAGNPLMNVGTLFFALIIGLILCILVLLLKLGSSRFVIVKKLEEFLSRKLFFDPIIRSQIEGYLNFSIAVLIALQTYNLQDTFGKTTTVMLTILIGVVPILFFGLVYLFSKERLEQHIFVQRFGSLYQNLDHTSKIKLGYLLVFFVRRLSLALTIVFASDYPWFQGIFIVLSSVLTACFILKFKPFNSSNGFRIETYNEVTILLVSYFYMINIELISESEMRYKIGWVVIGLIIVTFLVNMINVLVDTIFQIKILAIKIYRMICKKSTKNSTIPVQPLEKTTEIPQLRIIKRKTARVLQDEDYINKPELQTNQQILFKETSEFIDQSQLKVKGQQQTLTFLEMFSIKENNESPEKAGSNN